jgi:hypothetical protein
MAPFSHFGLGKEKNTTPEGISVRLILEFAPQLLQV